MADPTPQLTVTDRREWRGWLRHHHASSAEIWLVFFKKGVDGRSLTYAEALEEALCWGWIDGLKRRIDDTSYAYRFTPRKAGSKWSPRNIEIATRLIEKGRMTRAGLRAFEARHSYDADFLETRHDPEPTLPQALEQRLRADPSAWHYFTHLAPGYRKQYVLWITAAKRPETRERRLAEAVTLLRQNRKLGMK